MLDTNKLRDMVYRFSFYSGPSSGVQSNPCTVGDLKKVVEDISDLLYAFIDELEQDDIDKQN